MKILTSPMFLILWGAALVSAFLVIPYNLVLAAGLYTTGELVRSAVMNGLLSALAVWVGLKLGPSLGYRIPWLSAWLRKEPPDEKPGTLRQALILGAAAGAFLLLISWLAGLAGWVPVEPDRSLVPGPFRGLLASLYGAIFEEVQMRLFLMTLITWMALGITRFLRQDRQAGIKKGHYLAALLVTALLFALGHLGGAAQLAPLTLGSTLYYLLAGMVPGALYGWLYWKKGLEAAMVAHLATDLVTQVIWRTVQFLFYL